MTDNAEKKECFIIAPIGDPGSEIRKQSDNVLEFIVQPAAAECGFECLRADSIDKPGLITTQVIQHIVEAPLVVADLTGHNPNVMYELAIRHAANKPVVQIIHAKDKIPFDVGQVRTVTYDHADLRSAAEAKKKIVGQINAVLKNPRDVDTPVSTALTQLIALKSGDPLKRTTAQIFEILRSLQQNVSEIHRQVIASVWMRTISPEFLTPPFESIGGFGPSVGSAASSGPRAIPPGANGPSGPIGGFRTIGGSTASPGASVRPPRPGLGIGGSSDTPASATQQLGGISPMNDSGEA